MHFRTMLSAAVAAVALTVGAVAAPVSPGLFPVETKAPIILAQAGNQAVEEQVRQLNGRIEELNFQILQLQEQIRKMQEDNEFRFQELEGGEKKTDSGAVDPDRKQASAEPAKPAANVETESAAIEAAPTAEAVQEPVATANTQLPGVETGTQIDATPGTGEPPRSFGTIVFDQSGNVVGGSVGDQTTVSRDPNGVLPQVDTDADNTIVAALPQTDNPEELYETSYKSFLAGNYKAAEAGFRQHTERFPEDTRAADSQFWLGEAMLGQQNYRGAAEAYLAGTKKFPESRKAPDNLFKLGVSLAAMNRRDVACAAFKAVGDRYPDASPKLKARVQAQQAKTQC